MNLRDGYKLGKPRLHEQIYHPVYLLSCTSPTGSRLQDLHLGTRVAVLGMVQAWNPVNPDMAGAWNYPAWTFSAEAFFYICFPFVVPWMSRRSDRALFWLTAVLLTVCIVGHTTLKGLGDWKSKAVLSERVLPPPVLRIPEFLLGVVLGLRFLRQKIVQEQPSRPLPRLFRGSLNAGDPQPAVG